MNAKRIIPCLDVKGGRVVKGVNFLNLTDAGDPVEIAEYYSKSGADEIVFLDVTATLYGADTVADMVKKVARKVFVPLTVGGGIRSVEDAKKLLNSGADKIAINSAAVRDSNLINEMSRIFGSQSVVVAIDSKRVNGINTVHVNAGTTSTNLTAAQWSVECYERGAGEILLTSMDCDGTRNGFDLELLNEVTSAVDIPVIASGGAGTMKHFLDAFNAGADAALCASLFHYREMEISDLKNYLSACGVPVRLS